jgi:choline/glycine/proline betaine transport protein
MTLFVVFCLWLCASRYGRIRLGGDDERPRYSYPTWFAMLFSAGMGIGVLFWSVAEPVTHFSNPPVGSGNTPEAATLAMDVTLLHWGFHGWAVYVVVGLALAHFTYNHGLPLTMRSAFYPLLGNRVHGVAGHAIDVFAVLGTMFGVATTLGLGTQQINAGLARLIGIPMSLEAQIVLIAVITAVATASVVSGLDRGIRRLSELTMWLALGLLVFVVVAGPTIVALHSVVYSAGHYLYAIGQRLFWGSLGGSAAWQADWTLFYWGWWIAWSPFVGVFVARISRGRTVREVAFSVLVVPTAATCIWFSVFGGLALHRVQAGDSALATAVQNNFPVAIYVFFEAFPLASLLAVVGTIVVIVFFVTSSDSASLVIDYLTAGGDLHPPKRQRVFWATTEGVVAAILLISGGLLPMRAFQLATGLPLCIILLLMCYAIVRSFRTDKR